jgi:transcriptional regulator of nitric oxide reductase
MVYFDNEFQIRIPPPIRWTMKQPKVRPAKALLRIVGFTLLLLATPLPALERLLTPEQALALAYPSAARFQRAERPLTEAQRAWLKQARHRSPHADAFTWIRALDAHGHWLGSALLDAELGKHQPMDYLVALDPQGRVVDVELLTYREAYGGGVRSARFRAQFKGRGAAAALTLGQDVDAVSGATISSRTLADGVAKALHLFADLEKARP